MVLPELVVPKETARTLYELTGEGRPDVALLLVMRDARAYLLEKTETEICRYEARYGMSYEDYNRHLEQDDPEEAYSYEAETDYLCWEALVMRRSRLAGAYLA